MVLCAGCHTEMLQRLGKERDSDLARVFGLSRERIRQMRHLQGLPRFGTVSSDMAGGLLERLEASDASVAQIAAEAGMSYGRLRRLALNYGIDLRARQAAAVHNRRAGWADQLVALYASGATPDTIAEVMGIARALVSKRIQLLRRLRGVDALPYRRVPSGDSHLCRRCGGPKPDSVWTVLCPVCRGALHDILRAPRQVGASLASLSREFRIVDPAIRSLARSLPAGPGWLRVTSRGGSSKTLDTPEEVAYKGEDAVVSSGRAGGMRVRPRA